MAGLSDALTNKQTQATTLPSWYTTAQQNVVNQAQQAPSPTLAQTIGGQQALGAFQQGQPYQQASSTLGAIASGAISPWTVTTGPGGKQTVTPNVATPMGGLFKSQTDYLTSMMPEISAAPTGRAIGTGQFGSSANEAAVARARSQAINQLFQQQNQAALQAQQTGASAASALGNLGQNQLQGALNLATAEQADPYVSAINRANILAKLQNQPSTLTTSSQLGALNQLGALGSLVSGGSKGLFGGFITGPDGKPVYNAGLLDTVFGKGASQSVQDWFKNKVGGSATDYPVFDTGGSGLDTSGGDTSWIDNTDWNQFLSDVYGTSEGE